MAGIKPLMLLPPAIFATIHASGTLSCNATSRRYASTAASTDSTSASSVTVSVTSGTSTSSVTVSVFSSR